MTFSEHDLVEGVGRLLQSNRIITSRAEIAKHVKVVDDTFCRRLDIFERERGFELFAMKNGRLTLTEKGRIAHELYSKIRSLGDSEDSAKQSMKLEVESILAVLLLVALVPTLELWGSVLDRPSVWPLESDIRQRLKEKKADLGLGFADDGEAVPDSEALGSAEWYAHFSAGHRLGGTQEPLPVEQLPKDDWVLVPYLAFGTAGLADSFVRAGHRMVMECDHLKTYAGRVGAVVLPEITGSKCPNGSIKRRLVGLPPIQVRLFLPRGAEAALSSANLSLVENLRRAMREGLSSSDNSAAPATAEAEGKQECPNARKEEEGVFEEMVEANATPMADALS